MSQVVALQPSPVGGSAVIQPTGSRARLDSIDLIRGVVMVLMALDHTRSFFTHPDLSPLDLNTTTPALFLTRWVTHYCAPVFVFLAGTGAFLSGARGKTRPQLAWFLVSRGLWLVLLEFTLVHIGWTFSFDYRGLFAQVIWAIGWSMVLLAGLVFLPTWAVALVGVAIITCHNGLDLIDQEELRSFGWPVVIFLRPGILDFPPGVRFLAAYSILPWFGVMAAGYGFGAIWLLEPDRRRRLLIGLGWGLSFLFVVYRAIDVYGDPRHWSPQATGLNTLFSFVDCTKYPPSLLYVMMTLGPAILALGLCDRPPGPLGRRLVVFGRVPLFYYLLHVPLIHFFAFVLAWLRYGRTDLLQIHLAFFDRNLFPEGYGYPLPVIYLVWIVVVVCLYFPCRWFAEVKRRRKDVWLSYL